MLEAGGQFALVGIINKSYESLGQSKGLPWSVSSGSMAYAYQKGAHQSTLNTFTLRDRPVTGAGKNRFYLGQMFAVMVSMTPRGDPGVQ